MLILTLFLSKTGWERARMRKKKIYSWIPFTLDLGKEIPKKKAKKIEEIKRTLSGIIFSQNGII